MLRSVFSRYGCAWLIVLPVSLFIGLMIATAGMAIYPPVTAIATPLICAGEVVHQSQHYSYQPGQQGITRTILCRTGGAKNQGEDITMQAVGMSFLLYSAIAFLLLFFIAMPLLRRRFSRVIDSTRTFATHATTNAAGATASPVDLRAILARVAEAVERGDGKVVVRNMSFGAPDGPGDDADAAERLGLLRELRDQGLISAEDYEAKKAEILSGI
jgi:hypothetical protein